MFAVFANHGRQGVRITDMELLILCQWQMKGKCGLGTISFEMEVKQDATTSEPSLRIQAVTV